MAGAGDGSGDESFQAHEQANQLDKAMARCQKLAFGDSVYRIALIEYCGPRDLLSGGSPKGGSWRDGGRWNTPRSLRSRASFRGPGAVSRPPLEGFPVAYTSISIKRSGVALVAGAPAERGDADPIPDAIRTAVSEVYWHAKRASLGLPLRADFWDLRRVGVAQVDLKTVLDLGRGDVREVLSLTEDQLISDWEASSRSRIRESLTQAVGRMARRHGFQGLICPSARNRPDGRNLTLFPDHVDEDDQRWLEARVIPEECRVW